jgi:hypothetical protein
MPRVLVGWLFTVIVLSGVWIGLSPWLVGVWVVVIGIATCAARLDFEAPASPVARPALGAAALASLPAFVYLAATWFQEFPYTGDQVYHDGFAFEAYGFWWPWRWIIAVAVVLVVARWATPRSAVMTIALLPLIGFLSPRAYGFAAAYPGLLHFFSAPLRGLATVHPLNIERTLNALSIPGWLLILRPMILRRPATIGTYAVAALLFWQKDVVYYFASGYLEPWAVVLMLTALEHLVRFDGEAIWRPLLLIGTAAMVKEQMIMALPVVAAVYFPRRDRVRHIVIALTAIAPFALFFCQRAVIKGWYGVQPAGGALATGHLAAYVRRVSLQFDVALPVVVAGAIALIVLAARRRAFAALLLVALADFAFFFFAASQQYWVGYPRTNLVPLICIAIALGTVVEWLPRGWGVVAVLVVLACNAIPLLPEMREAFGPDTGRNFIEETGAAIFYPVRQSLMQAEQAGLIHPGDEVDLLNNGKHIFGAFYTGPIEEQYPDLALRYRIRVMSFRGDAPRCRCSDPGAAQLAVFIAFHNLGTNMPQRRAIEQEAEQCRAAIAATCKRVMILDHAVIGR